MKTDPSSPTLFNTRQMINCRGKLIDLFTPRVMGILNITPDSFYDGGKFTEQKAIIKHAGKMLSEGADFIDVGAQSSRPGAKFISENEELKRILPVISGIMDRFPDAILSVDTFRANVAEKCIKAGAAIINDISGGSLDSAMFRTVASLQVPYILMHMKGKPLTMQLKPRYKDVISEIMNSLGNRITKLRRLGVYDIIIDPGFGFGKSTEHNYRIMKSLSSFTVLDCPILAGVSRKSMICKVLHVNPEKALNGTTALNMAALMNGASILRVHDVKPAKEVVNLFLSLRNS